MIAAILAVVGSILSLVENIVGGENNKFLQRAAEMQARIEFERQKDLQIYGMYAAQAQTRNTVIIAGTLFVLGIAFMAIYANK